MTEKKVTKIEKVLLINPFMFKKKNRNVGIDPVVSRHAGQEIKTGVTFPIGLAYLGAMLKRAGYEIRIMDPIAESISTEKIYKVSRWADAIIMPFSPSHQEPILRYFSDFKGKLRIMGGTIAAHLYDYLFKNDYADVVLRGEPEETIVELVDKYPTLSLVDGIIYCKEDGSAVVNKDRPPISDLNSLPFPIRGFTDPANYWDISFYGQPTAWILPARGCPYNCIFCAQHELNQRKVRRRSPRNIVDEIEQVIKEQNVTNFAFFDETFNQKPEFSIGICDEIIRRGLKIKWICAARPDLIREDVVRKMKEAGCIEMRFGLESANDEILQYLNKGTSVAKILNGINITKKVGVNFSLQCIFGSPMESKKTIRNTMRFIKKVRPLFVSFNVLTPLPGSQLFEQVKEKLDLKNGLENFDILHTDYPLGRYSSDELAKMIKKAYISYYFSFGFLLRMGQEFLKNPLLSAYIFKTLFTQGIYIMRSILLRK